MKRNIGAVTKKRMTLAERIKHEEEYVEFLKKRLDSQNFKNNSTEEEYKKTQDKYEKAKFLLKTLNGSSSSK